MQRFTRIATFFKSIQSSTRLSWSAKGTRSKYERSITERREGSSLTVNFQHKNTLLDDAGADYLCVHLDDVLADGLQEGKVDVPSLATLWLLLIHDGVLSDLRASAYQPDARRTRQRGDRHSHLRFAAAHLLSDWDPRVSAEQGAGRPRYPARLCAPARQHIRVSTPRASPLTVSFTGEKAETSPNFGRHKVSARGLRSLILDSQLVSLFSAREAVTVI